MCLDKITKLNPVKKEGFGYKVFFKDSNGNLYGEFYRIHGNYKINKWYKSNKVKIYPHFSDVYNSGFHIFERKKSAYIWEDCDDVKSELRKVQYRKAHTLGKQIGLKVIVAKEMKILEK